MYDDPMAWSRCARGLVLPLVLVACRSANDATNVVAPVTAEAATTPSVAVQPAAPVVIATSPLELLPATTPAFATFSGVAAVLDVVELDAVIGKFRPQYDMAANMLQQVFGVNLLDPNTWGSVGIDANGPLGAALIDVQTSVVFARVSDPVKFRKLVDGVAGPEGMLSVFDGYGQVLRTTPDSRTAVVLRDGFVMLVWTDRPVAATADFAQVLATIDPAHSLASTPRYQQAIAGAVPDRRVRLYVDAWGLIAEKAAADSESAWATAELDRAIANQASAEELDQLRQRIAEVEAFEREMQVRRNRVLERQARWLRPIGPVVVDLQTSRTGIVGELRVGMPESAAWRQIVRNAEKPPQVFAAPLERPMFMLGTNFDVAGVITLGEDMIREEGTDPQKLYRELQGVVGFDIRDALKTLRGDAAISITATDALFRGDAKAGPAGIGVAVTLGVHDEAAARAVVERLVALAPKPPGKHRSGAHIIDIAGYRPLYVTVAAGNVVATTDLKVLTRLEKPADTIKVPPAVIPMVTATNRAVHGYMDMLFPLFFLYATPARDYDISPPRDPYWLFSDLTTAQVDAVPQSRAYKTKLREWKTFEAKIRAQEAATTAQEYALVANLAAAMGVVAVDVQEHADGLVLTGALHFGPGGVAEAVTVGSDLQALDRDDQSWQSRRDLMELEQEIQRMRAADVAKHYGVPVPSE